ncbi:MAG: tyrosine-type recombinase/integrase [Ignavibacterium sp.]|nr:tyrosine-type recombinase/integrase [Ignavibacterium sp.]
MIDISRSKQFKRYPLTEEEQIKLVTACKNLKEKFTIIFLIETGLRVSEFVNLKLEDIEWQTGNFGAIKVYGKRGFYGTNKPYRIVPLTEPAKEILKNYISAFGLPQNVTVRAIQKRIKQIANRSGIEKKISCHNLRHTFAVNCLKKGINLRALQLLLGHSSISVTQIYLSLSPQDIIKEFNQKMQK